MRLAFSWGALSTRTPSFLFILIIAGLFGADAVWGTIEHWHVGAVVCTALLLAWIYNHKRYRAIADTPRSKIASAAQGYTELHGIGRPLAGEPLLSPITFLPCLWFRLKIESKDNDNDWTVESDECSNAPFILNDGSGECLVDPQRATVVVDAQQVFNEGRRRSTLWMLVPGTRIYLLGHFTTHSAAAQQRSLNEDVRDKLADWKLRGHTQRFDLNADGNIDEQEWQLARAAARRETEQDRREHARQPDRHSLGPSPDGRAFLISDIDPDKLQQRYRLQARGCLALFFAVLAMLVFIGVFPS